MTRAVVLLSLAALAVPAAALPQEVADPVDGAAAAPPQLRETITVSATRQPLGLDELTATAHLLRGDDIRRRPALGLDEALRWIPSLSLLRRSPARAAHPTSQGINLRGVAPSGTSRALVLVDGLPLSDPFGGWIYWNRIPQLAVERVEVVLGGGSSTFGNEALAGTVQIAVREPDGRRDVRLSGAAGSQSTYRGGFAISAGDRERGLLVATELFGTGGYLAVEPARRGSVDVPVATAHQSLLLRGRPASGWRVGVELLHESRDNGTPEQTNSTRSAGFHVARSGGVTRQTQVTAFGRWQRFRSRFSSVASDRSREIAVLHQEVPSSELGASAHLWRGDDGGLSLGAGADLRRVSGESREDVLLAGFSRRPGGTRTSAGLYLAARLRAADAWRLEAAVRGDAWRQTDRLGGSPSRDRATLSPRIGLLWAPHPIWSLRAAAYRSFRAPTLNELFRQFRVGNVSTAANDELREETLTGWDAAVEARPTPRLRLGLTVYGARLRDGVVNATIGATSTLLLRQRRNLGEATISGLEVDAGWRGNALTLGLAAALLRSRVVDDIGIAGPTAPSLVGNRLPQVPTYRLSASLAWQRRGWSVMAAGHAVGRQFEDDRNELPLAAGFTADVAIERQLRDGLRVSLRGQNLTDRRLQVGRTPVLTLGPPRSLVLAIDFDRILDR